jgi:two-component system, NtrC family, nitrogen regulation sensor histidine kinase NtrY
MPPGPRKTEATRTRRYVVGVILFLLLALITTQIFLHQTSVGSKKFVPGTFVLWAATVLVILAILALATVLGRNLIKLFFERRSGIVGSGFRSKIVSLTVVLSLLPALLLFILSYGLINFSIEQWFSAPASLILKESHDIAQQYYDEIAHRASHFASVVAGSFLTAGEIGPENHPRAEARLTEMLPRYQLSNIRLFNHEGGLAAEAGQRVSGAAHKVIVRELVANALRGQVSSRVERVSPSDALREVVWGAAPIRERDGRIIGAVLTEGEIAQSVRFKADSVLEAHSAYLTLQRNKATLRFNVLLILALSTLLIVFAFSWFAMYLAKRITVPIQALAEGAAAVAAGDLDYRVDCEAIDELGSLIQSFNRMTGDLKENKRHIEAAQDSLRRTNVELDIRRRYTETILQNIATGVISLSNDFRIRTLNRAAAQMLEIQAPAAEARFEDVVKGSASDALRGLVDKSAILGPVVRTIELSLSGKALRLATTVTPLLDAAGQRAGWVIVLDDVTELLRIEKMAAWQEVARRLAHEIKNPLTPIQLSAERILMRYRQLAGVTKVQAASLGATRGEFASFTSLLEESVRTITEEAASLKNLVDEFSRFARLPEVRLEDADLHRIIDNTLGLYNGRIHGVRVVRKFDPEIPQLRLDPEQLKRVFINLFDNALEAMADNSGPRVLEVATHKNEALQSVRVRISDTGRGFPREYQDSLFLPYFSTRKGGTGLGLAIVRQVITDHHGYVRAEPNSPLGTSIIIDLPLAAT